MAKTAKKALNQPYNLEMRCTSDVVPVVVVVVVAAAAAIPPF